MPPRRGSGWGSRSRDRMDDGARPFLVTVQRLAHLTSLSASTIWKLDATSRIPSATRVADRPMWGLDELRAWVAAGCPVRDHWEIVRDPSHVTQTGVPHPAEHQLQDHLLVRAAAAAAIVGVSLREFLNANTSGYLPRSLHLGSARLWRPEELRLWIEREYPARGVWELSSDGEWRGHPRCGGRPFPPEHDLRGEGPPWLFPKQVGGRRSSRADAATREATSALRERSVNRRHGDTPLRPRTGEGANSRSGTRPS